jgi:hypothetical protein
MSHDNTAALDPETSVDDALELEDETRVRSRPSLLPSQAPPDSV